MIEQNSDSSSQQQSPQGGSREETYDMHSSHQDSSQNSSSSFLSDQISPYDIPMVSSPSQDAHHLQSPYLQQQPMQSQAYPQPHTSLTAYGQQTQEQQHQFQPPLQSPTTKPSSQAPLQMGIEPQSQLTMMGTTTPHLQSTSPSHGQSLGTPGLPPPLAENALSPSPSEKRSRTMKARTMLNKYADEILTPEESKKVRYWNTMDNALSLSYLFLWVPLTFAFYAKYKLDKVLYKAMPFRIITIHCVQLPLIFFAQTQRMRFMLTLEKKYTKDLSDYEIDNFDELFKQLQLQRQQQQQQQSQSYQQSSAGMSQQPQQLQPAQMTAVNKDHNRQ